MRLVRDKVKEETWMCKKLCDMAKRGELRSDYFLQRETDQWEHADRDNFIVTVLLNEDFDALKICEEITPTGVTLWIIDGLQKYTYLSNFRAGKFKLGTNIDPEEIVYQEAKEDENGMFVTNENGDIIYDEITFSLKNKGYEDLPPKLKENFENCPVKIVKHLDCTPEEMARHLRRYNRGAKMKPAQILLTRMLNVGRRVKALSEHDFWSDRANFTPTVHKNGKINQIIAEIVMALNFWDNWTKNARKIGEYLNENATDEMFNSTRELLDHLMTVTSLDTSEDLFTTKNSLIWIMFFDRCLKNGIKDEIFKEFLNNFNTYADVLVEILHNDDEESSVTSWNELDAGKSTKDRGVIEDKLFILHTLLEKFVADNGLEATESETENVVEEEENNIPELETTEENEHPVEMDSSKEDFSDDELIGFVMEKTSLNVDSDDIELYKDIIEDSVKVTSSLYQNCYKALIAVVAKACDEEKDQEFEGWVKVYQNSNEEYSSNDGVNFRFMQRDFENYLVKNGNAA